jgi:hypothetical protein
MNQMFPNPVNVALSGQPIYVRQPQPNPVANRAQSGSQLQYSPAIIYHYQNWSAASGVGVLNYTFFGASVGNNGATFEDTNMLQPNNVGAGNTFIVAGMWVDLKLGQVPVTDAAEATVITANTLADYNAVMQRGVFQMAVNNIPQLGNGFAPLKTVASPINIMSNSAVSTGSGDAAAILVATPYTTNSGFICDQDRFTFNDQTPFSATVSFPGGAVTLPSANNTTKIGVVLKGWWFRPAG